MKVCISCSNRFSSDNWRCKFCGHTPPNKGRFNNLLIDEVTEFEGFNPAQFSQLAELERSNFWFKARTNLIKWALIHHAPKAKSFLEVGCGTGFVMAAIRQANQQIAITGSELFSEGLEIAAARVEAANFIQADARALPYFEEFDVVGIFDVLEHIRDDEGVLNQIHKTLKKNGILILTVPQHPWLWSPADELACHVRRYTCDDLEQKLTAQGFDILRSTSFVTTLLPAMVLSRAIARHNPPTYSASCELKISAPLNQILYACLELEGAMIRMGINFPIGGSRLVVAKKLTR